MIHIATFLSLYPGPASNIISRNTLELVLTWNLEMSFIIGYQEQIFLLIFTTEKGSAIIFFLSGVHTFIPFAYSVNKTKCNYRSFKKYQKYKALKLKNQASSCFRPLNWTMAQQMRSNIPNVLDRGRWQERTNMMRKKIHVTFDSGVCL